MHIPVKEVIKIQVSYYQVQYIRLGVSILSQVLDVSQCQYQVFSISQYHVPSISYQYYIK